MTDAYAVSHYKAIAGNFPTLAVLKNVLLSHRMSTLRLTRANEEVGSFLSVLGSLRETRLTAVLGYLVSRFPVEFGSVLGFRPSRRMRFRSKKPMQATATTFSSTSPATPTSSRAKSAPSRTPTSCCATSAAAGQHESPPSQWWMTVASSRQSQQRDFQEVRRRVKHLKFVTWAQVAAVCQQIARLRRNVKTNPTGTVIAHELANYLKENNMTTEPQPEIYLRDVSDIHSVQLYFRHNLYKSKSNFYNSARRNLYFAPYFTHQMADKVSKSNLVPVGEGISFVSRIKKVQVVRKRDVQAFLQADKHPNPKEAAEIICANHRESEVLLMSLGDPRLMFISPVTKAKLKEVIPFGLGAMGSRSCAFDDLLAASQ